MTPITISLISDTATPAIKALAAGLTPARLAERVGPALQTLTRDHLAALGPNKQDYPTTRFYEKFADQTRWLPAEYGLVIQILPAIVNGRVVGLGLRVFGGTITPQTVDRLAVPISPISYGHVPSDFPNLFLVKTATGAYLCQDQTLHKLPNGRRAGFGSLGGNAGRRNKTADALVFLFVLKSSVTQEGNRDVLPSNEEYQTTAINRLKSAGGAN